MAERGRSANVNISSIAAQLAMPVMSVYGATQAALLYLTRVGRD